MEEYLCERRSTISYRDGAVFRKYYKYAKEQDVLLEMHYAIEAKNSGINCPAFIGWGYNADKQMFYSEFEYVEIRKIERADAGTHEIQMALDLLCAMPKCKNKIAIDDEKKAKELLAVSPILPKGIQQEYENLVRKLLDAKSTVMIHGDYSFENIGWDVDRDTLITYDFQNSGYGTPGWDKAYLLSSIPNTELASSFSEGCFELIKIFSALRYGRGLRKQLEVDERKRIYEFWWK